MAETPVLSVPRVIDGKGSDKFLDAVFDEIERRLTDAVMEKRTDPTEIATTFNFVLFSAFGKPREHEEGFVHLSPVFVGQYRVDPKDPEWTRVFCHQGTECCSPLPIDSANPGIINWALRTGEDRYVPDVEQVDGHIGCDPRMRGTEIVLLTFSEPYSSGPHKGCQVPLGVLDIDLNVKDALSEGPRHRLRRLWDKYGKLIFPGEASFEAKGDLFVAQPQTAVVT